LGVGTGKVTEIKEGFLILPCQKINPILSIIILYLLYIPVLTGMTSCVNDVLIIFKKVFS